TALELHPVASRDEANWFIEQVRGAALGPGKQRIEAVVRGIGGPAAERRLSVQIDGKTVAEQTRTAAADGRASLSLDVSDLAPGFARAELVLEAGDALAADDRRGLVLEQRAPARVLFAGDETSGRDWLYFSTALAAGGAAEFAVERCSGRELAAV